MKEILENYLISKSGYIYSKRKGRFLKPYKGTSGYLQIELYHKKIRHRKMIHRLVAQTFIPNPENKPEVNHKDGDKLNNHSYNLEWVTASENQLHAYKTGLKSAKKLQKLTPENVKFIRANKGRFEQKYFMKMFGVSQNVIGSLIRNETYKEDGK